MTVSLLGGVLHGPCVIPSVFLTETACEPCGVAPPWVPGVPWDLRSSVRGLPVLRAGGREAAPSPAWLPIRADVNGTMHVVSMPGAWAATRDPSRAVAERLHGRGLRLRRWIRSLFCRLKVHTPLSGEGSHRAARLRWAASTPRLVDAPPQSLLCGHVPVAVAPCEDTRHWD